MDDNDVLLDALTNGTGMASPLSALAALEPSAEPEVIPEPSGRGEVTARIVEACGLQHSLAGSRCLSCATSVLAQDANRRATLYCSALFRDLEVSITDCTAYSPA